MTTEPEPAETSPSGAPPADDEFATARAVLDEMRPAAANAWRVVARRELETAGVPLTKRTVDIRAAELATRPAANTATA